MPATSMRWCPICEEWFTPDRYNAWHQHYCSKPSCRAASHDASSAEWRRKNPGYFRGEAHCMRVRSWRADHPGYWRGQRRRPAPAATPALQDTGFHWGAARTGVPVWQTALGCPPKRTGPALSAEEPHHGPSCRPPRRPAAPGTGQPSHAAAAVAPANWCAATPASTTSAACSGTSGSTPSDTMFA